MMKRKSDPKQCKSIGGLIAVAVVLAAAGDAARMATGGTASGTHTLDGLEFLPPPDPQPQEWRHKPMWHTAIYNVLTGPVGSGTRIRTRPMHGQEI